MQSAQSTKNAGKKFNMTKLSFLKQLECNSDQKCPAKPGQVSKCTSCNCVYTEDNGNGQCTDQDGKYRVQYLISCEVQLLYLAYKITAI